MTHRPSPVASSISRTSQLRGCPRAGMGRSRRSTLAISAAVAGMQTMRMPALAGMGDFPSTSSSTSDLGWRNDFASTYIKGRAVGSGSFGQVFNAINVESGAEVAVKVLPKIRGKLTREKTLEKITRETDMLTRLQGNSGVVRLLELFEDANSVQIVTELCAGGDLQKYVEKHGPLDERSLALVTFEVLKIVKSCHDLGILHGDVKPANFCLKDVQRNFFMFKSTPTNLRAIDFGCSQFLGSKRLSKRTGTPVFMAPEIFARDYSHKADIWGIGVMLYWLYCRRFPFFDNTEVVKQARLEEVADAVNNVPIKYDFGPWCHMSPQGLDFIQRCLVRNEEDRMSVEEALQHEWLEHYVSEEQRSIVRTHVMAPAGLSSHAAAA